MLENLLADRFRMTTHWSSKRSQGYSLVVSKSGPKLKLSPPDGSNRAMTTAITTTGHLVWNSVTMDRFANSLAALLNRPVIDATGIQGVFDIVLDVAPDSLPGFYSAPDPAAPPLPSILVAIKDLGLNLQLRDVEVKQLVVESALKIPTEN